MLCLSRVKFQIVILIENDPKVQLFKDYAMIQMLFTLGVLEKSFCFRVIFVIVVLDLYLDQPGGGKDIYIKFRSYRTSSFVLFHV